MISRNNLCFRSLLIACFLFFPGFLIGNSVGNEELDETAQGLVISKSFELRYVSEDPKSKGETDFKGPTEVFDTQQRIEYLSRYANYAGRFFSDPELDTQAVQEDEVRVAADRLKPQPLPSVRRRLPLVDWKYLGFRAGQKRQETRELSEWKQFNGTAVHDGELLVTAEQCSILKPLPEQKWRMFLSWRAKVPTTGKRVSFALSKIAVVGFNRQGKFFYTTEGREVTAGAYIADQWYEFKVEVDCEDSSQRYNFYVDGELKGDFVPFAAAGESVDTFVVNGVRGMTVDDIWGVGYTKGEFTEDSHSRDVPFSVRTIIDEDFTIRPEPVGFELTNYDDSQWLPVPHWPYAHGGERHAGEDLYLRTSVQVGEFERAVLELECLDPGGEIWINGEIVTVRSNRHPDLIDVTKFLRPSQDNLIAVHVRPFKVTRTMRHTATDLFTGWFAGRMSLDLTNQIHIDDVFVTTKHLDDKATVQIQTSLCNDRELEPEREVKQSSLFSGQVVMQMVPWFPREDETAAITATFPISIDFGQTLQISEEIEVPEPQLWSPESPKLYKVVVHLEDDKGNLLDDFVITTGIRTISQEGGTFRINGKPAMMNGALLFGFRSPLDRIAQWQRCGPLEWLVRELLMLKNMNANTARMSHHDGPAVGINDPRYAEIGDQLGILFQWGTTAWVRTGSPWQLDFEGLPKYVQQVRNHPSIVMWQPSNHPKFSSFESSMSWFKQVYDIIYAKDPSRLICPTANLDQINARNDDGTVSNDKDNLKPIPVWTAPMIVRGNMDNATGYGANWESLRKWPFPNKWDGEQGWRATGFRTDYLNSKYRAYFNFENEESIGQPNWTLRNCKPSWQIASYELDYDKGSIGRRLSFDEWRESQAWQAFSAYEAIRKMRWLDYDGFAWCTLRGGGNSATYQKPLIDYYGYAKLAFHTVKMAYQSVLAGSGNVDLVYHATEQIPILVMNLGPEREVTLLVSARDMDGNQVASKIYSHVTLPAGRSRTDLPPWSHDIPKNGHYAIEYTVFDTLLKK